ncbi:hypothetical protein AB0N05_04830 [Nocardia sp. NPDC051030]|uniref:hypothetical protein n=1 Tax=Nocardia sp. NPDC051030 TaxID=3155162 RepID=UPI00343B56AE
MNHREQGREALTQQLLQLRGEHPELSLRTIGIRAQVSHTTVSRAFSTQDRLPSWPSIAAIAHVLGGVSGEVEPLWQWAATGTPPTHAQLTGEAPLRSDPMHTQQPWFIPVFLALVVGLIILAIVSSAIPAGSTADRWLGNLAQTVFAITATIAFGLRAFRAAGFERRWLVFACLAVACWSTAIVCWVVVHEINGNHQRGTTIAEVGFHTYSLLMIIALWLRLRNNLTAGTARENTVRTVALTTVTALSVPAAVWLLSVLPRVQQPTDSTLVLRTYLHPITDGAMIALAMIASVRGIRVTQSRLLAIAFSTHAVASILATTNAAADPTTDLVASSEFGFTTFTVLLALAAIAPTDTRIRPVRHQNILTRALQATGLAAIITYTLTLATGHLPAAITPFTAAAITLLLVIALVTSLHHPHY